MTVFLLILAAVHVLGALAVVASVGKSRGPVTPAVAVVSVVSTSVWVTGLVTIALSR